MSGHTPGPWHVGECHGGAAIIDVKARGLVVARVLVISADPSVHPLTEARANANAIAAAPDMLAALKDLRAMVIGEHGASAYENVNGERADAAIAKAEGRT